MKSRVILEGDPDTGDVRLMLDADVIEATLTADQATAILGSEIVRRVYRAREVEIATVIEAAETAVVGGLHAWRDEWSGCLILGECTRPGDYSRGVTMLPCPEATDVLLGRGAWLRIWSLLDQCADPIRLHVEARIVEPAERAA